MSVFLQKYVRVPIDDLIHNAPDRDALPDMTLSLAGGSVLISVDGEKLTIPRSVIDEAPPTNDDIPEDID